jgi:hypothetical protein
MLMLPPSQSRRADPILDNGDELVIHAMPACKQFWELL